ncbi:MAG: hypothetical protein PUP90_21245 [Nostoc sp. S4]|nr:hypothetical protein [Nostoc sp. S4]
MSHLTITRDNFLHGDAPMKRSPQPKLLSSVATAEIEIFPVLAALSTEVWSKGLLHSNFLSGRESSVVLATTIK